MRTIQTTTLATALLAFACLAGPLATDAQAKTTKADKAPKTEQADKSNPLDLIPAKGMIDAEGKEVTKDSLKGKIVGFYFSAHWCGPCRAFTPKLVEFRDANTKDFEVVFVSADQGKDKMLEYMKEAKMKWGGIPPDNEANAKLSQRFGVRGIPMLVIVGTDGKVISENGRGDVTGNAKNAIKEWQKKKKD